MLKKRTREKGNNKKSSEEGSDCLIKREELEWALDCVQTRNCRVDLNMISSLNKNGKENIVEGEDNTMNSDVNTIEYNDQEDDKHLENNNDNRLSVLSPFFDLMNHDVNVQTVFEVKKPSTLLSSSSTSSTSSISSSSPPSLFAASQTINSDIYTEPVLTVRYEGHGVKKGDQVSLNYRR